MYTTRLGDRVKMTPPPDVPSRNSGRNKPPPVYRPVTPASPQKNVVPVPVRPVAQAIYRPPLPASQAPASQSKIARAPQVYRPTVGAQIRWGAQMKPATGGLPFHLPQPARFRSVPVTVVQRAKSADLLTDLAKPKVLVLPQTRIDMQKEIRQRLETYPEINQKRVSLVGLGAVELPEILPEYSTSGIISRCRFVDAPEPRAQGMSLWAYDLIKNDTDLTQRLVINTIRTMEQAGQLAYLKKSGLTGGSSVVLVEIHYYRDRDQSSTAFHKDTVGETLFVNLNYLNDDEIAGPEYILNPRPVTSHEEKIRASLPAKAYRDLLKVRTRLSAPTKIKWAGNLPAYGVVAFTDETIHHATPLTEHRTVYSADLKTYLQNIHPQAYQLAEQMFGHSTENLRLPYIGNAPPISKQLFDMANVPPSAGKWYNRTVLRAAMMPANQIDELLDTSGKRGHVAIQGQTTPIIDPNGATKTLHRKISRIQLNDAEFPRQATGPRSFFRTWVRTIRRENRRPEHEKAIIS